MEEFREQIAKDLNTKDIEDKIVDTFKIDREQLSQAVDSWIKDGDITYETENKVKELSEEEHTKEEER